MGNHANEANQVGQTSLPSRESTTQHQFAVLLSVMNTLNPYLLMHAALREVENTPALDGGVASSASLTFINVCNRMDAMLADKSRWDTATHDRLYDAIQAVQMAQVAFLHEQAESAKALRRPSVQLHPTLANDGEKIIAYYGDITRVGYAIIGVGRTPAEALLDFDRAFDRAPTEQVRMVAENQGVMPPSEKPKPKKKQK